MAANREGLPFPSTTHSVEYDTWFRHKVQEALDDRRPNLSHNEVEAYFAKRRESGATQN